MKTLFELAHEIMALVTYAISEGSGQPAHPRSHKGQLVRAINLSDRGVEEKICMEFNGNC